MWGKGRWGGYYIPAGFRTISSGYLKISRIKESPQFGWVKKLQRTVGFQICFFFQNTFENHIDNQVFDYFDNHEYPWYPSWSTTDRVTISNTRPLPHKYIALPKPYQIFAAEDLDRRTVVGIWVSGPRQTDNSWDLGFKTLTDGRTRQLI